MYVDIKMYFDDTFPSLINGDDMFATFNSIPMERAMPVWVYRFQTSAPIRIHHFLFSFNFCSRVYLYFFICLFIYVVLSLFISIIMDTYEIIKNCYDKGFPPNRLQQVCKKKNRDSEDKLEIFSSIRPPSTTSPVASIVVNLSIEGETHHPNDS